MNFIYDLYTLKSSGDFSQHIKLSEDGSRILTRIPSGYIAINENEGKQAVGGQFVSINLDDPNNGWEFIQNEFQDMYQSNRDSFDEQYNDQYDHLTDYYHPGLSDEAMDLYDQVADQDGEADYGELGMGEWDTVPDHMRFSPKEFLSILGVKGKGDISSASQEQSLEKELAEHRAAQERDEDSIKRAEADRKAKEKQAKANLEKQKAARDARRRERGEKVEAAQESAASRYNLPPERSVLYSPVLGIAVDSEAFLDNLETLETDHPDFEDHEWWALPYPPKGPKSDEEKRKLDPQGVNRFLDPRDLMGVDRGVVPAARLPNMGTQDGALRDELHAQYPWTKDLPVAHRLLAKPKARETRVSGISVNPGDAAPRLTNLSTTGYYEPEEQAKRIAAARQLKALTEECTLPSTEGSYFNKDAALQLRINGLLTEPTGNENDVIFTGNFKGYEHQLLMIAQEQNYGLYERTGGLKGYHGFKHEATYGAGKTSVFAASSSAKWNDPKFGLDRTRQLSVIICPNANRGVWGDEMSKFQAGEETVVIEGSAEVREALWQDIIERVSREDGSHPLNVVVGASVFRLEGKMATDGQILDEDAAMDMQYMNLLNNGGTMNGGETQVAGGHVGVVGIDESGLFYNPDSVRTRLLHTFVGNVARAGGYTTILNGDVAANGARDVVVETALINTEVRENLSTITSEFTQKLRSGSTSAASRWGSPKSGSLDDEAKVKDSAERAMEFSLKYQTNKLNMGGEFIAGDDYGLFQATTHEASLGHSYGTINDEWEQMAITLMELPRQSDERAAELATRGLGMLTMMNYLTYGGVHPARLLETGLVNEDGTGWGSGVSRIFESLESVGASAEEIREITKRFSEYQRATSTVYNLPGTNVKGYRLPNTLAADGGEDAQVRNKMFENVMMTGNTDGRGTDVSTRYMELVEAAMDSWDVPALDYMVERAAQSLANPIGKDKDNSKFGIGMFSTRAAKRLERMLLERFGSETTKVLLVDGTKSASEIARIQKEHQEEKNKNVITIVTAAGARGLSLPADSSVRAVHWSPAMGRQMTGRSHRNQTQEHIAQVVSSKGGVTGFMQSTVGDKERVSEDTLNWTNDFLYNLMLEEEGAEAARDKTSRDIVNRNAVTEMTAKFTQYLRKNKPEVLDSESRSWDDARRKEYRDALTETTQLPLGEYKKHKARQNLLQKKHEMARKRRLASESKTKGDTKKSVRWGKVRVPSRKYEVPTLTRNPLIKKDRTRK